MHLTQTVCTVPMRKWPAADNASSFMALLRFASVIWQSAGEAPGADMLMLPGADCTQGISDRAGTSLS